jgi:hypothetical protein
VVLLTYFFCVLGLSSSRNSALDVARVGNREYALSRHGPFDADVCGREGGA